MSSYNRERGNSLILWEIVCGSVCGCSSTDASSYSLLTVQHFYGCNFTPFARNYCVISYRPSSRSITREHRPLRVNVMLRNVPSCYTVYDVTIRRYVILVKLYCAKLQSLHYMYMCHSHMTSGRRSAILPSHKCCYRLKGCGCFVDKDGMRYPYPGFPLEGMQVQYTTLLTVTHRKRVRDLSWSFTYFHLLILPLLHVLVSALPIFYNQSMWST